MYYKAAIVDDQQMHVDIIERIIQKNFPQIEIIAKANTVETLIAVSEDSNPDILFLDINLGDKLVFEALDKMNITAQIIFVSSEQEYAINAFRHDAVDFILKPISKSTLIAAIVKAIRLLESSPSSSVKTDTFFLHRYFSVSSIDKQEIFKVNEIIYCAADGRGTVFYLADGRKIFSSRNLKEYDCLMNRSPLFIKISRHYIVNFAHVRRIIKKGGPFCEMLSGISIPISRRKLIEVNKVIFTFE